MTATPPSPPFNESLWASRRARYHSFDNPLLTKLYCYAADVLAERLREMKYPFQKCLLLGSARPFLKQALANHFPNLKITRCDMIKPYDLAYHDCLAGKFGDKDNYDLIISSLFLHGLNDLPCLLTALRPRLQSEGMLLANFIGGYSFVRLREAIVRAETEISGGVSPRIAPMIDVPEAAQLIQYSGYQHPLAERDRLKLNFDSFTSLLGAIRQSGEANVLNARQKSFTTRSLFEGAHKHYRNLGGADSQGNYSLELELITISGWG